MIFLFLKDGWVGARARTHTHIYIERVILTSACGVGSSMGEHIGIGTHTHIYIYRERVILTSACGVGSSMGEHIGIG